MGRTSSSTDVILTWLTDMGNGMDGLEGKLLEQAGTLGEHSSCLTSIKRDMGYMRDDIGRVKKRKTTQTVVSWALNGVSVILMAMILMSAGRLLERFNRNCKDLATLIATTADHNEKLNTIATNLAVVNATLERVPSTREHRRRLNSSTPEVKEKTKKFAPKAMPPMEAPAQIKIGR